MQTLTGHSKAVWCVVPHLSDGTLLTGATHAGGWPASHPAPASADTTIKRWDGEQCIHTYTGHGDVVRELASLLLRPHVVMPGRRCSPSRSFSRHPTTGVASLL